MQNNENNTDLFSWANEIRDRLIGIFEEFEGKMFEREELIRLIVLAIFCKQHLFLFGKPGVAKTLVARLAANIFGTGKFWEILMAHDTTTEQLMGSLKRDENGSIYRDLSDSMLDKEFVFLDEMFKGSNKVLNALLGPMLDRIYSEGNTQIDVPLITLFGASNEFPEGEDIKPFEDRLMFRYNVLRIQKTENKKKFHTKQFDRTKTFKDTLSLDDITIVEEGIENIIFPDAMLEYFIALQDSIISKGRINISDRKFGPDQAGKVFRVSAFLNGRKEINYSDLMLLKHIAWHNLLQKKNLEDVLTKEFFGDIVIIESELLAVEQSFDRAKGLIDSLCFQTISYQKEYVGQIGSKEYNHDVSIIKMQNSALKEQNEEIDAMISNMQLAGMIEAQCKKNIFLFEIKQTVYNNDIVDRIKIISSSVKKIIGDLDSWVEQNSGGVFNYNRERERRWPKA